MYPRNAAMSVLRGVISFQYVFIWLKLLVYRRTWNPFPESRGEIVTGSLPAFMQHTPLTVHSALAHAQLAPVEIRLLVIGEIPYLALAAALGAAVQGDGL